MASAIADRLATIRAWRPAGLIIVPCDGALETRLPQGFAVPTVVGLMLALSASFPFSRGVVVWLVRTVPGAGFLRDGQKFLIPLALAEAVSFGVGVDRVVEALPAANRRELLRRR